MNSTLGPVVPFAMFSIFFFTHITHFQDAITNFVDFNPADFVKYKIDRFGWFCVKKSLGITQNFGLRYSEALLHHYYIIILRYSEAGDLRLSGSLHVHLLSGQNNEAEDNCHYPYIIVTFYPVKLWWWSKKYK